MLLAVCQCSHESVHGIPTGFILGIVIRLLTEKLQNLCISCTSTHVIHLCFFLVFFVFYSAAE